MNNYNEILINNKKIVIIFIPGEGVEYLVDLFFKL